VALPPPGIDGVPDKIDEGIRGATCGVSNDAAGPAGKRRPRRRGPRRRGYPGETG